jgi:predicted porin
LNYQSSRKGGAGTLAEQYFQQPQPDFLFNLQNKQKQLSFRAAYELLNSLNLTAYYSSLRTNDISSQKTTTAHTFSLGFTYGF